MVDLQVLQYQKCTWYELWKVNIVASQFIHLHYFYSESYNLKRLSFAASGYDESVNNGWDEYPDRFDKILQAISKSDLANSLKELNIFECGITKTKAEQMMNDNGLSHIKILDDKDDYPTDES